MSADREFPRLAAPLGLLASLGLRLWRRAAPRGERVGIPVLSVGNLCVGGTGKTPVVLALARWLEAAGHRPAILSRGYRRPQAPKGVTRVSHRGRLEAFRWELAGDEPWFLARTLPRTSVYVSARRVEAARLAELDGASVLLLDDGFQHLRLARDFDLVCLRGDEASLRVLPAGPLREPLEALRFAGAGVWVRPATPARSGEGEAREAARDAEALFHRLAPGALRVQARLAATGLRAPDGSRLPMESLQGESVGLLCGIARPERFVRTVREYGARIEALHTREDHHVFGDEELDILRTDLLWLTTEKDAVRLSGRFPAHVVETELLWETGGEELRARVLQAAGVPPEGDG